MLGVRPPSPSPTSAKKPAVSPASSLFSSDAENSPAENSLPDTLKPPRYAYLNPSPRNSRRVLGEIDVAKMPEHAQRDSPAGSGTFKSPKKPGLFDIFKVPRRDGLSASATPTLFEDNLGSPKSGSRSLLSPLLKRLAVKLSPLSKAKTRQTERSPTEKKSHMTAANNRTDLHESDGVPRKKRRVTLA